MVATAEEGRERSNQLNLLNEQLIGGRLDRKLEEAGRGGGEGEGGEEERGGHRICLPARLSVGRRGRDKAEVHTEAPTGGSE